DPFAAGLVVEERKRRRRLGPDDELRTASSGLARHREVRIQDAARVRRIPFLILRNISLNERDADLPALTRKPVALDAMVSPRRESDQRRGGRADRDHRLDRA